MLHRDQGLDIEQAENLDMFCKYPSGGKHCSVNNYSFRCGVLGKESSNRGGACLIAEKSRFW
ncbi:hypothetical protein DBR45_26890, partial [Pseudomonas sp. HMWF031]